MLTLADGTQVSSGDRIITRANDRRLGSAAPTGSRTATAGTSRRVTPTAPCACVHDHLGTTITLPAGYVTEHVQLGYATTVHGAQGVTAGTCHAVLTGDEDRQLLYVALSRGRPPTTSTSTSPRDGDPHNLIRPEALFPPTALDLITGILRRDGTPTSAATTLREQTDPTSCSRIAARYHDAVTAGAENLLGP